MVKKDELYPEALEYIVENKTASVSMLQRKFRIGYTRAAKLIDQFEIDGHIGPYDGAKPREVLTEEFKAPKKKSKKKTEKKAAPKSKKTTNRQIPELGMNERQKLFCDYYIETGNATEASLKAGYSERTARQMGSENLSKPSIKKYIADRMAEKQSKLIASQDEILAYLTSIMRGKEQEKTLYGLGMGEQGIVDIDVGAKDRIKAAELLGKRYAMWTEKVDVTGDMVVNIVDDVEDLEEDEE